MQLSIAGKKILLWNQRVDFRKSIDGLCYIIAEHEEDPAKGIYVFYNRGRNRLKILFWHGNGFVLIYKRLERGRFYLGKKQALNEKELSWLLAGLDWQLLGNSGEFTNYL